MYNNAIFLTSLDKIPTSKCWAIYLPTSYAVPGWDKNDPPDIKYTVETRLYKTEEDWLKAIKELYLEGTFAFKAAVILPASADFDITINVKNV